MNSTQAKTNSTNRVRTIVLCTFAFILLSGLMVLVEYSELKNAEKRERHILKVNNQIHKITTIRREIEEIRQRNAELLQKIIDRQIHYETADHHHPDAKQQIADLAHLRKQTEELLHQSAQQLATCDRQLTRCEQMLQNLAD